MTPNNRILVIGEKESFIVRVLMNKAIGAGGQCEFVPYSIDEINNHIKDVSLVTIFMEDFGIPPEDVMHFIIEKMQENGLQMLLIGDEKDILKVTVHIPQDLIYKTFTRPVDNAAYIKTLDEFFKKSNMGDFKKTILVVDDDPSYLGLVREWLKDTYKVFMVNSGLQAIKWLGKNKVDLILLDHEMPVTSGPQVLEMLRSDEETRNIPVMFLTGKSDKDSVMEVVALKPEGYFLKSIQREELLEKLQEFFILHK